LGYLQKRKKFFSVKERHLKAKSNYGYKHEKKKPKTQITTKYLIKKTKDKNSKI